MSHCRRDGGEGGHSKVTCCSLRTETGALDLEELRESISS